MAEDLQAPCSLFFLIFIFKTLFFIDLSPFNALRHTIP